MSDLDDLLNALPDAAKDLRLNLQSVLAGELLTPEQAYGVALASAFFVRSPRLRDALLAEATTRMSEGAIDDARAAAAIMGMNTVYYRFRHMIGIETYSKLPARLRMQRMAQLKSSKATFEMFSLACAALAGCEACQKAHEASLRKEGLSEAHVHDVVRIAAVVQGVAIALELQ